MSSLMWYIFDFARKAWADAFANAKSEPEISEKPERFRDFPKVNKEYCIGCGACTVSCPSPNAIKLVRDEDTEEGAGMTYPVINWEHVSVAVSVLRFAQPIRKHWNVV